MANGTEFRSSYTARDFETIFSELEAFVLQTRPELFSDFFESNLGVALIQLNALVGDVVSFGQDIAAMEVFLATARRLESALRFARSVGYIPRSANPAEVTVDSINLPESVTTNGATIAAGAVIAVGDLQYELLDDAIIPPGSTLSALSLFEGTTLTEEFDESSSPNQEIVSAVGIVADLSWQVFIGDPGIPTNEWTQVTNVSFEESATETYEVFLDGDGKLHVTFGDGTAGKIPDDTITLIYRTTLGAQGNLPAGAVRGAITAELGGPGGSVSITYENTTSAATGGRDRESINELRVNVPAFIRSVDKILTLRDYETNVLRVPGVNLVFADVSVASFSANLVNVHVWDEEDVTFVSESVEVPQQSDVDYSQNLQVPLDRANDIQAFLRPRTIVSIHSTIIRPDIAFVDIYLRDVTFDPRFGTATVHKNITEAVVGVFEASTGFALRVSDLYNALDSALGVEHFTIDRILFEHLSKTEATGTIELTLQPTDGDTITINDGTSIQVYEFDDNAAVTGSNVAVIIGSDSLETLQNLLDKINSLQTIDSVRDFSSVNAKADLTQQRFGSLFNFAITKVEAGAVIVVTGMAGGDDTPVTRLDDHRRIQNPLNDPYPPGAYVPGAPFVPAGPAWLDGGQLPYKEIEDLVIISGRTSQRFYDETFLYNNEIFYDAGLVTEAVVQAINLRRLVFELLPEITT